MTLRVAQISAMLDQGRTHQAIGRELGISGPRVSQIIAKTPELRRRNTSRSQTERQRLLAYKHELEQTLRQVHRLAADIEHSIQTISEEVSSIDVDRVLGLREA